MRESNPVGLRTRRIRRLNARFSRPVYRVIRSGDLPASPGGTITFEGEGYGSGVSFFHVHSQPGEGPDLQIWGSGTLYPGLLERAMLDRLTVLTYPLVLGKGKRLFRDGTPPATLRIESGRMTSKGTAIASFVPELGVAVGTSPPIEANASEEKRQRAIAEGSW